MLARPPVEGRRGAIVTIVSQSAKVIRIGQAAYGASKAAASYATKCLGLELASAGIRCNVIHPGVTETPRDWAIEFDKRMASVVASGRHSDATGFLSLGPLAQLAHPTYDHFLPFLYALGLILYECLCGELTGKLADHLLRTREGTFFEDVRRARLPDAWSRILSIGAISGPNVPKWPTTRRLPVRPRIARRARMRSSGECRGIVEGIGRVIGAGAADGMRLPRYCRQESVDT